MTCPSVFDGQGSRSWVSLKLCNTLSVMLCVRNGQGSAGPSCASVGELLTVTEPAFFWVTAATKPSSYSHQSHHTHTRISPISHTHSFSLILTQKKQNIIVTCQFHLKHSSNLIWLWMKRTSLFWIFLTMIRLWFWGNETFECCNASILKNRDLLLNQILKIKNP